MERVPLMTMQTRDRVKGYGRCSCAKADSDWCRKRRGGLLADVKNLRESLAPTPETSQGRRDRPRRYDATGLPLMQNITLTDAR
jgi:hypothetical protein